ncbi:hypothetical protein EVAR_23641_1 [Eumeta japonica]|uniref:Uncharacterized protein n=1 Tax=Eumeta variegata TaxID=151549 RepID=A0A4C1VJH1_EUMVA|nr:hypothetical protein EVAR_23641_1 [Eumeta japonica]
MITRNKTRRLFLLNFPYKRTNEAVYRNRIANKKVQQVAVRPRRAHDTEYDTKTSRQLRNRQVEINSDLADCCTASARADCVVSDVPAAGTERVGNSPFEISFVLMLKIAYPVVTRSELLAPVHYEAYTTFNFIVFHAYSTLDTVGFFLSDRVLLRNSLRSY